MLVILQPLPWWEGAGTKKALTGPGGKSKWAVKNCETAHAF